MLYSIIVFGKKAKSFFDLILLVYLSKPYFAQNNIFQSRLLLLSNVKRQVFYPNLFLSYPFRKTQQKILIQSIYLCCFSSVVLFNAFFFIYAHVRLDNTLQITEFSYAVSYMMHTAKCNAKNYKRLKTNQTVLVAHAFLRNVISDIEPH